MSVESVLSQHSLTSFSSIMYALEVSTTALEPKAACALWARAIRAAQKLLPSAQLPFELVYPERFRGQISDRSLPWYFQLHPLALCAHPGARETVQKAVTAARCHHPFQTREVIAGIRPHLLALYRTPLEQEYTDAIDSFLDKVFAARISNLDWASFAPLCLSVTGRLSEAVSDRLQDEASGARFAVLQLVYSVDDLLSVYLRFCDLLANHHQIEIAIALLSQREYSVLMTRIGNHLTTQTTLCSHCRLSSRDVATKDTKRRKYSLRCSCSDDVSQSDTEENENKDETDRDERGHTESASDSESDSGRSAASQEKHRTRAQMKEEGRRRRAVGELTQLCRAMQTFTRRAECF